MIEETSQAMTYEEREHLKTCRFGDQAHEVIRLIAHWHRQSKKVAFSLYASNWAEAEKRRNVSMLRAAWPFSGKRMIKDNCSDWDSYSGKPQQPTFTAGLRS